MTASIPPAIITALYPGQPDARPSVEDVCAEIVGLRETSQQPRAVRLKSELRALTLRRKAEHEEEDHDHIMVGDVEVARVEYGETDAEGRGVGDDIGPADVDAWFATPSPTPAPTNTAEVVRAIVARLRARAVELREPACLTMTRNYAAIECECLADRIERDHAPSAPVERVWTRAEVLAIVAAAVGDRTLIAVEHIEACNNCGETFTEEEQRAFDPNDNDHCPKCGRRGCLTTYFGDPSMEILGSHLTYGDNVFIDLAALLDAPSATAKGER